MKSQIVTSSWGGMRRALPYAFTQEGLAMLSSVLRSERAVQVNIGIMRAFVRLRGLLGSNADWARKVAALAVRERATRYLTEVIPFDANLQALPMDALWRLGGG